MQTAQPGRTVGDKDLLHRHQPAFFGPLHGLQTRGEQPHGAGFGNIVDPAFILRQAVAAVDIDDHILVCLRQQGNHRLKFNQIDIGNNADLRPAGERHF